MARHSSADDCWLISHGRVYNVTAFLRLHPAGEMAILRHGGQDSTVDFDFHPSRAQAISSPTSTASARSRAPPLRRTRVARRPSVP